MAALDAIRPVDANPGAVVIPLTGRQASNRIKAMLTAAGFDGNAFSGHSGRVGLARAMSSAGAPDSIIARQAGWKDPKMVSRYTRRENRRRRPPVYGGISRRPLTALADFRPYPTQLPAPPKQPP